MTHYRKRYFRRWRMARRKQGYCHTCLGRKATSDTTRCAPCMEVIRMGRKKRVAAGYCYQCTAKRGPRGTKTLCPTCAERNRTNTLRWYYETKRKGLRIRKVQDSTSRVEKMLALVALLARRSKA